MMAYFPNGTSGDWYEQEYCSRCVHGKWLHDATGDVPMCAVMTAHLIHNYDECNKPGSILHILIPRNGIDNEQCKMFLPVAKGKVTT